MSHREDFLKYYKQYPSLYINCKWQPQLHSVSFLKWAMKHGLVVVQRDVGCGRVNKEKKYHGKRNSYLQLTIKGERLVRSRGMQTQVEYNEERGR